MKDKRFCKGCYDEVTKTMYCKCGETSLLKSQTYSEKDMQEMESKNYCTFCGKLSCNGNCY